MKEIMSYLHRLFLNFERIEALLMVPTIIVSGIRWLIRRRDDSE